MNLETTVKKISIDPGNMSPTVTVEFVLENIKELEAFKKSLVKFQQDLVGQKRLKD